jgi:hypothetical protein
MGLSRHRQGSLRHVSEPVLQYINLHGRRGHISRTSSSQRPNAIKFPRYLVLERTEPHSRLAAAAIYIVELTWAPYYPGFILRSSWCREDIEGVAPNTTIRWRGDQRGQPPSSRMRHGNNKSALFVYFEGCNVIPDHVKDRDPFPVAKPRLPSHGACCNKIMRSWLFKKSEWAIKKFGRIE